MNKLKQLFFVLTALTMSQVSLAAAITYDTTEILANIATIETTGIAVLTAFITLGMTMMFYRKIRGMVSKG